MGRDTKKYFKVFVYDLPSTCNIAVLMKKIKTWKQLLADPRVLASEIWQEDNDGTDYWIPLADGYTYEGCSCIHEWSKRDAIDALNCVKNA
tara:strand:+ start:12815 stop:13087 length:273 start_codon:yes stop_codon:yes gene_type:complete